MSLSQLSKQILKLRKEHKMTQGDLAKEVGVSTTAISQFEKGVNRPSLETLTKLSAVLGEDLRELVPHIGRFPILSTENNIDVPIISGNQYDRLKWDYLRRNESEVPDARDEANYSLSKTAYAYESLSLPPSLLAPGQHIVYPMPGNQMAPTFEYGDLLLCSLVNDQDWTQMQADSDDPEVVDALPVYVVEVWTAKERSLHFGRFSFNAKKQTLRCYQDDRSIPYRIPIADIKMLWKFQWCLTKRFYDKSQKSLDKIRELEQKVIKLRKGEVVSDAESSSIIYRTFRERLKEIIIGQHIVEGEFLKGDYIDLANDIEVQQLYIREYGQIQDHQAYMQLMERIILDMVRTFASDVQEAIDKEENNSIKQNPVGFLGDFRDDFKELLKGQLKSSEDINKLDFRVLAKDRRVQEIYINEYGPITNMQKYINDVLKTMQQVAFEISLSFN